VRSQRIHFANFYSSSSRQSFQENSLVTSSAKNHRTHRALRHLKYLAATVLAGSFLQVTVVQAQSVTTIQETSSRTIDLQNRAGYSYDAINDPLCGFQAVGSQDCPFNEITRIQGFSSLINAKVTPRLIDPLGRITGCAGEALTSYTGFSVGLYTVDPSDPTGTNLGGLVSLTQTEFPDRKGNDIPAGLKPNTENSNPFYLSNGERGNYNFLLDPARGQVDPGRAYILVVNPPRDSIYSQRRVRIAIVSRNGNQVSYTATSLDGKPVSAGDGRTTVSGTITVENAEQTSLILAGLDLDTSICQAQEIQIIKTGDRAAAEPGDTVIYRLSVRNLSSAPVNNLAIVDTLPLGFNFLPKSVRAELQGNSIPVTTTENGSTVTFNVAGTALPQGSQNAVLNIVYGATLTPDSVRGSGQNSAIVNGRRLDNQQVVKDGPAVHRLRVRRGIVSDCGTIIGRVFVDKNFDGEQQPGEPGVPNSVIFLDDGTRITTDPNGLFSLANVLPGYRTGVLDLSSVPGYTLAPNLYFSERNSQSRLVRLEPGGLVRMNFAVTPTFNEVGSK
jgi:uncharacterized repeat protein (TIGR01451 family)